MATHYKYFSWHTDGIFYGNKLLTRGQIYSGMKRLMRHPRGQDIFTTIQSYNSNGEPIACPFYLDFDGVEAQDDAQKFVSLFEDTFKTVPNIYYSGKKGFHLVLKVAIVHPLCHIIVREILKKLNVLELKSLDFNIYSNRRLWRVPGTFHTKGFRYKMPLSQEELFLLSVDEIRQLAKKMPEWDKIRDRQPREWKRDLFDSLVSEIEKDLANKPKRMEIVHGEGTWEENITPCLRWMLENEPSEGKWHYHIFTLAKFFKFYGVPKTQAQDIMTNYPHYFREQKHVMQVFKSTYASNAFAKIGCKGQSGGDKIMRDHCDILCKYNQEELDVVFAD